MQEPALKVGDEALHASWRGGDRAAGQTLFERYFDAPTARPMSTNVALAGLRADGTEIDVEVSLSPIRTGSGLHVAAAIRDIRDRRRIEADARISADRLATAVDSIEDAIAVFSSDDRLVLCNSACRRIFASGVAGPVTNMPFERLLDAWIPELALASEGDRDRFREARLAERGQDRAVFDVRTKVGQSLRVNLRRTLDGGLVQTFWDLTDDVRRKEELQAARRAAEEGLGVLVVSADLAELRVLCHRLLVMRKGRIVAEMPPSAPEETIGRAMLGLEAA